jgi:2-hydroxychromene-2-carboxylate isomerase
MPYSEKKRAYVFVDVVRQAQFHGIPIETPEPFPVASELALCVALVAGERPGFAEVQRALFHAAWRERRDLSQRSVVAECLRAGGIEAEPVLDRAEAESARSLLTRRTREADDAGVFGVPTLSLDGELFWGLDALPVLDWRLGGSRTAAP